MILIKTNGYAFPEVLIASAVFSAGILALAKLSIITAANLQALQQDASHAQQTHLLSLTLGSTPMDPQSLLQHTEDIDDVQVLIRNNNNQRTLPAPLYRVEVRTKGAKGVAGTQSIVTAYAITGAWQDVVLSDTTEHE